MSRYIYISGEAEVEIDLYDIIEDISSLYYSDAKFKKKLDKEIKNSSFGFSREDVLDILKNARKDVLVWDRLKPDLEEMMKEDYVVVM